MFAGKKLDNKTIYILSAFVEKHSIIEKIESKDYSPDQKLYLSLKYLDTIQNLIDTN